MSTKPIREALEWLPEMASRMPTESTKQAVNDEYDAALEAVRAIEEMARFMVRMGVMEPITPEDVAEEDKASALLRSIAKEAP